MQNLKIVLNEVTPQGLTLAIDDQAVWEEPMAEFGIAIRVVKPLQAEVFLLPQEDGCLVRGRIRGEVAMPCDRCAEDAHVVVEHDFDDFEEYPSPEAGDDSGDGADFDGVSEDGVLRMEGGSPVLDISALLWEEFSLSLPVKPLCMSDCKGVCPLCGKNLNMGSCLCASEEGDPRLAALRSFKVKP